MKRFLFSLMIFLPFVITAQRYTAGVTNTVYTKDMTKSAFVFITTGSISNRSPDISIAFSRLQEITRADGTVFHIFYQEDITGNPITLGIDRELVKEFNGDIQWEKALQKCMLKKLEDTWTSQKTAACADCILKQLNQYH